MNDFGRLGLVGLIIFLTHLQEGITGFGCSVLALPFITLLLGLHLAVPVLVILGWLLALCIVLESRKKIVWSEFGRIALLTGIGLPLGIWASTVMPEDGLKWALSVFMVGVGVHGLVKQSTKQAIQTPITESKKRLVSSVLPLGGIIHGAFGSGGPLVVIYAARALPNKTIFRVTLCMVWFTLNSALIAQWALRSSLDVQILRVTAFCAPFTLAGMWLGNKAHYRINEAIFRIAVYAVLAASGITLAWSIIH